MENTNQKILSLLWGGILVLILLLVLGIFLFPKYSKPVVPVSITQYNQNKFDEVISDLKDSDLVSDQLILAATYLQQGTFDFNEKEASEKALAILREVAKKSPNNPEAYRLAGYANEIVGKYNEAIFLYSKALEIAPDEPLILAHRGHAYALKGDKDFAESDIMRAFQLRPGDPIVAQNAARIFLEKNDIDSAERLYNQVSEADDASARMKAEANAVLASVYLYYKSNVASAVISADKATKQDPNYYLAHISKARVLLAQNKDKEALESLKKAVALHKNSVMAYEWIGITYYNNGQYSDSVNSIKYSMSLLSVDNTILPEDKPSIVGRLNYYLALNYANPGNKNFPNNIFDKNLAVTHLSEANKSMDFLTFGLLKEAILKGDKGPFASLIGIKQYDAMVVALKKTINK